MIIQLSLDLRLVGYFSSHKRNTLVIFHKSLIEQKNIIMTKTNITIIIIIGPYPNHFEVNIVYAIGVKIVQFAIKA